MAGNVVVNSIQLGNSTTASQNFVWITNIDGTCKLARGNLGATTQDIITVDTNGKVAFTQGAAGSIITSGTAQATTSGTSIDFTGIPSWVKRITINFSGVSTNGTSNPLIQIGDSGGIETSAYLGAGTNIPSGTPVSANYTTGFGIGSGAAANLLNGSCVISLLDSATNTWSAFYIISLSSSANVFVGSGSKATSATLDRVRITTVAGADTFDAGSINILYE